MPCTYKRKTDRASTALVELERAVKVVLQEKTIRQVAREMKICRMTLKRFREKKKIEVTKTGYKSIKVYIYIKVLAAMFYGISAMKCRELAFEYAQRNGIDIPASWIREKKSGPDWFTAFKARHHLSCHTPEATSLGRATCL
uniref:Transposase n=1 Tax=Cyprinus carpio TaxID=7962 RepID=A0A8C2CX87_CYPCA